MPRSVRGGTIYQVMSRWDRGEKIFLDARDRVSFLETLGEACQRSGAVGKRKTKEKPVTALIKKLHVCTD